MCALLRFFKVKPRPSFHDGFSVGEIYHKRLLERKYLRLYAVHKGEHVEVKIFLQFGVLIKLIEYFLRYRVVFKFDKNSKSVPVRFVAHVFYSLYFFVLHELGDFFKKSGFVDLIRNFGDYNVETAAVVRRELSERAHRNHSLSGYIRFFNRFRIVYYSSCRKIRPG